MPVVQCPNPINCIGTDSPTANLSAEGPDEEKCFRYAFTPDSTLVCEFPIFLCNEYALVGSDVGVLCPPVPPWPPNPPPPLVYSSSAQSCTVTCPDLTSETYTVVAGTFVGLSQVAADAAAQSFACELATILCTGPLPQIFTNTEQSCTVNCANGTTFTYTTPEGFFSALSQADANLQAFLFACELAALLCSGLPPIGTVTSAGVTPAVPNTPLYGNFAQACSAVCPDGSTFTYVVPGGTYFRESRLAANAVAFSLACDQANHRRVCLSDLETHLCSGEFYGEFLDATGIATPITFSLVAGTLPPGVTLDGDFLQGVPTTAGVYSFAIRATGSNGSFTQRTYTQTVADITPDLLPDGDVGSPYAEALTADGFSNPVFSIAGGALPDGLTLHPSTGVISGTPTLGGDFDFTVQVSDGSLTCTKALVITIGDLSPIAWYTGEQADPSIDVVNGANLVAGASTNPLTVTPGKVNNALTFAADDDVVLTVSGQVASLAPGNDDMNFFGWFIMNPPVGLFYQNVQWLTNAGEGMAIRFYNDGAVDVFDTAGLPISLPAGTVQPNVWTFWHLKIAAGTGIFSFALDNAAPTVAASDYTPAVAPSAEVSIEFMNAPNDPGIFSKIDEFCIFNTALTQDQVDGIYNGGLGRTYP